MSDALGDGRSVIARVPPLTPAGLHEELTAALGYGGWALIRLDDDGTSPARQALTAVDAQARLSGEVSAVTLTQSEELAGRVFWCAPSDVAATAQWLDFIDQYAVACRARPSMDAPRFIVSLSDRLACPTPAKKVGVEVVDVGTAMTQTDMLLLAYYQMGGGLGNSIKAQVMAQTAASVALWDVELLNRLMDEPPERLFAPTAVLTDYAKELGWTATTPKAWEAGTLRRLGDKDEIHSALLALNDSDGVVTSRVWAGQAAILLPVVERRRLELIQEHRPFLKSKLPLLKPDSDDEQITDPADVEVGLLWRLLRGKSGAAAAINRAKRLRDIRNDLAHLTPLMPGDAFAPELLGN